MKIAIISDIHGNLEALEAVLRSIAAADCQKTYCLGDLVGYGPAPNEVCARVRGLGIETIQGNHDEAASLDIPLQEASLSPLAYKSLLWTRNVLAPEHRQWLRQLPKRIDLPLFGACLCHASPENPGAWEYITSRYQAWDILERQTQTVCFIGHTHRPFAWVLEAGMAREETSQQIQIRTCCRYLVNAGSVGQPRNRDPRCSYVILDGKENLVAFQKVEYSIATTQRQIREQLLPDRLAERLAMGV